MSHSKLGSSGDKTLNVTAMISLIKTKSSNAQIAEMLHCFSAAKKLKPHPAAQTKKKKKNKRRNSRTVTLLLLSMRHVFPLQTRVPAV